MESIFTWGNALGALLALLFGILTCGFDLHRTLRQSDFQPINPFKSLAINSFILLNGMIGLAVFVVTCLYPGEWVSKHIGQEITNPAARGLVVGLLVTVIIRSQLFNMDNEKGAGVDMFYAALRSGAIRRLLLTETMEKNRLVQEYQKKVCGCPNHSCEMFVAHLTNIAGDLLKSIHSDDTARRDRMLEAFTKATAGITVLSTPSDLRTEGLAIKLAIEYCGATLIKDDIDHWLWQQEAPGATDPHAKQRWISRLRPKRRAF